MDGGIQQTIIAMQLLYLLESINSPWTCIYFCVFWTFSKPKG